MVPAAAFIVVAGEALPWSSVEQAVLQAMPAPRHGFRRFPDLPSMLNALTPKRLELLQDVHREPASSVKALAERLGRDYKRVHEDVETLAASGLLQREDGRVSAPYDAITAEMRL